MLLLSNKNIKLIQLLLSAYFESIKNQEFEESKQKDLTPKKITTNHLASERDSEKDEEIKQENLHIARQLVKELWEKTSKALSHNLNSSESDSEEIKQKNFNTAKQLVKEFWEKALKVFTKEFWDKALKVYPKMFIINNELTSIESDSENDEEIKQKNLPDYKWEKLFWKKANEGPPKLYGSAILNRLTFEKHVLIDNTKKHFPMETNKIFGFYFAHQRNSVCISFTQQLIQRYHEFRKNGIEIIFVSSDMGINEFNSHSHIMPWLSIKFTDRNLLTSIRKLCGIHTLPSLKFIRVIDCAIIDGRDLIEKNLPLTSLFQIPVFSNDIQSKEYIGVPFFTHLCEDHIKLEFLGNLSDKNILTTSETSCNGSIAWIRIQENKLPSQCKFKEVHVRNVTYLPERNISIVIIEKSDFFLNLFEKKIHLYMQSSNKSKILDLEDDINQFKYEKIEFNEIIKRKNDSKDEEYFRTMNNREILFTFLNSIMALHQTATMFMENKKISKSIECYKRMISMKKLYSWNLCNPEQKVHKLINNIFDSLDKLNYILNKNLMSFPVSIIELSKNLEENNYGLLKGFHEIAIYIYENGKTFDMCGNLTLAYENFRLALIIHENYSTEDNFMADILGSIASILAFNGKTTEAIDCYNRIFQIKKKINQEISNKAKLFKAYGDFLVEEKKNNSNALNYYKAAFKYYDKKNTNENI